MGETPSATSPHSNQQPPIMKMTPRPYTSPSPQLPQRRPAAISHGLAATSASPIRWAHRIILAVVGILLLWVIIRAATSFWIGGKAVNEVDTTGRLLGLTDELRSLFKLLAILLVTDLALPLLTAGIWSMLGRRVRWTPGLAGRVAALLGIFALKPTVSAITGLDFRDGMPSKVVEINPEQTELFDSRSGKALVGVVVESSGERRFYNLRVGIRPSDGTAIRPVTHDDVAQWRTKESFRRTSP